MSGWVRAGRAGIVAFAAVLATTGAAGPIPGEDPGAGPDRGRTVRSGGPAAGAVERTHNVAPAARRGVQAGGQRHADERHRVGEQRTGDGWHPAGRQHPVGNGPHRTDGQHRADELRPADEEHPVGSQRRPTGPRHVGEQHQDDNAPQHRAGEQRHLSGGPPPVSRHRPGSALVEYGPGRLLVAGGEPGGPGDDTAAAVIVNRPGCLALTAGDGAASATLVIGCDSAPPPTPPAVPRPAPLPVPPAQPRPAPPPPAP
ncbi:hypothetical protein B7P34_34015, partial [Streptosporangium nondiastaticum]